MRPNYGFVYLISKFSEWKREGRRLWTEW